VGGDGAEGRREETRGEFKQSSLRLGNEAPGEHSSQRELIAKLFVEFGMELMSGLAGEERARGEAAAMQRDCEAVAGEGRDDGGLVTDGPEILSDGVTAEKAVRDGADGKRAREERFGFSETRAEVRCFGEERGKRVPAAASVAKELALDDEAEIRGVGFGERVGGFLDEGETAIAAGNEEELDGVAELGELVRRETEVHLEANEVGVCAEDGTREPAKIVLAGGEKDMWRGERVGVTGAGDRDAPEIAVAMQGFGDVAAEDKSASGCGAFEESFVECATCEGLRGERESCRGDAE